MVEGEKTADAAQKIYPDFVTVSCCNHKKTDWDILKGRELIIFPDNDKPGKDKATKLAHLLGEVCKSVHIVPIWEHNLPRTWDLADPIPDSMSHASLLKKLILPEQLEMSGIFNRCQLIRTTKYESKEDMGKDIRKMCRDHIKQQPGKHSWPSDTNCCEFCPCKGVVDRPLDLLEIPEIFTDYVYIQGDKKPSHLRSLNCFLLHPKNLCFSLY